MRIWYDLSTKIGALFLRKERLIKQGNKGEWEEKIKD